MSFPGNGPHPSAVVDGFATGLSTTPIEVLPFPGENVQYFLDHLYGTIVGGAGETVSFLLERDKGNAILRSSEFDNASWTKTASVATANNALSPLGALEADLIAENTANSEHSVSQGSLSVVSGKYYVLDVYVKAAGRSIAIQFGTGFTGSPTSKFDIRTLEADRKVIITDAAGAVGSAEAVGGYFRCRAIAQATSTTGSASVKIYLMNDSAATSYTGDNVSGAHLWGASFRNRDTSNDYVATTTAAVLTQAASRQSFLVSATGSSGISMSKPTAIPSERGAPIRAIASGSIATAIVGVSGYKAFRRDS